MSNSTVSPYGRLYSGARGGGEWYGERRVRRERVKNSKNERKKKKTITKITGRLGTKRKRSADRGRRLLSRRARCEWCYAVTGCDGIGKAETASDGDGDGAKTRET